MVSVVCNTGKIRNLIIVYVSLFKNKYVQSMNAVFLAGKSVKQVKSIEVKENTAYGPIGSVGAHPQAPVYEEVTNKPQDMFSITHNTAYGQTGIHMALNGPENIYEQLS